MIEFDENTVGVWYVELGKGDNYLASLKRTPTGHEFTYRFRYEGSDPRPFDGNDRRSWWQGSIGDRDTRAVVEKIRSVVSEIARLRAPDASYDELLMDEQGLRVFFERLSKFSWAHTRKESVQ